VVEQECCQDDGASVPQEDPEQRSLCEVDNPDAASLTTDMAEHLAGEHSRSSRAEGNPLDDGHKQASSEAMNQVGDAGPARDEDSCNEEVDALSAEADVLQDCCKDPPSCSQAGDDDAADAPIAGATSPQEDEALAQLAELLALRCSEAEEELRRLRQESGRRSAAAVAPSRRTSPAAADVIAVSGFNESMEEENLPRQPVASPLGGAVPLGSAQADLGAKEGQQPSSDGSGVAGDRDELREQRRRLREQLREERLACARLQAERQHLDFEAWKAELCSVRLEARLGAAQSFAEADKSRGGLGSALHLDVGAAGG